jgi:hypothetical protein
MTRTGARQEMPRFSVMIRPRFSLVELKTEVSNNLSGHLATHKYDLAILLAPWQVSQMYRSSWFELLIHPDRSIEVNVEMGVLAGH